MDSIFNYFKCYSSANRVTIYTSQSPKMENKINVCKLLILMKIRDSFIGIARVLDHEKESDKKCV